MSKKGILFDFNGTMFFDSEKHKEAWDVFSRKYRNCPITEEELDHMHGKTNKKIIEMLLGNISDEESERLSIAKEALYRDCCRNDPAMFHLAEGLEEVLDTLKMHDIPMTICSASIKDNIDFFITSFHLDKWFDIDKIIYDDGNHIDKISMFHDGAKAIGVDLKDCMIIEDSLSGLDFAYQCKPGMIVAITTPSKKSDYEKIPGVNRVIYDFHNFDFSYFFGKD